MAIAVLNLVGWGLREPTLLSFANGLPAMGPFTAELMLLASVAMLVRARGMLGMGVVLVALATALYANLQFAVPLQVPALHPFQPDYVAGLGGGTGLTAMTALAFVALGISVVLLARRPVRFVQAGIATFLTAAVVSGCWTMLANFTWGVIGRDQSWILQGFTIPSALGLLFLGLAVLQRAWRHVAGRERARLVRWGLAGAWAMVLVYVFRLLFRTLSLPTSSGGTPVIVTLLAVTMATLGAVMGLGVDRARRARAALEATNAMLRQREMELARSMEWLRAARDGALDAFFLVEAVRDGAGAIADFRFMDLNPRGAAYLGQARDTVPGRCLGDLLPSYRAAGLIDRYVRVVETGVPLEEEFADPERGQARWVHQQVVKVGDGVAITTRDVTASRQLEEQFRHAQKMEAVGRVASGVAHDFNNLLTVVRGITEMLVEDPTLAPRHRADLREVAGAVTRGSELTSRLLAFSRRQPVAPTIIATDALVTDVVSLARRVLPEGIHISVEVRPGTPTVLADRLLLEQALMNLILNARDAMAAEGALHLATEALTLAEPRSYGQATIPVGRWTRISIRDSGGGMAPEVLEHLFEPFFTTKPTGKGTGLGLSTAFGIIRQAEGHLVVGATGPDGTTMHVYLPACQATIAPAESPATGTRASGGTERILVVDDDTAVRDVVRRILVRAGYDVHAVDCGEAAEVAIAKQAPFALLVTDMVMPGIGGGELARRVALRQPDLRVLYISGYTDDDVVREAHAELGRAFLPKPFTADELLGHVRDLLDEVTAGSV